MQEYFVTKLAHDDNFSDETDSRIITKQLNKYSSEGWALHSTQFLPIVGTPSGAGDLVLIFVRTKEE